MKQFILLLIPFFIISCNKKGKVSDAYGNFEAEEVIIAAESQGKLVEFYINEGDKLRAGQVVGYIDSVQLYLKFQQLLAQKKAVKAKIENIRAQKEVQEQVLNNLKNDENRIMALFNEGAATKKQLDDITGQIEVTKKQIESINTQFILVNSEIETTDIQIIQARDQLNRCKIINPVDGTVLAKYVERHELINIGKNLYKIANLNSLVLKAYISGYQLASVKTGQQVDVLIDKNKSELLKLRGTISWISETAEFTPKIIQTKEERVNLVYAIKVLVSNDGTLKIGMPGEVIFNSVN
jgi:HlyD family secretion protein